MFKKRYPLTQRKTIKMGRATCCNCGKYSWAASLAPDGPLCDSCDLKMWRDDRDISQFDAATERAQGIA